MSITNLNQFVASYFILTRKPTGLVCIHSMNSECICADLSYSTDRIEEKTRRWDWTDCAHVSPAVDGNMAAVLALEGVADSQRQLSALFFPIYFHTHRLTGGDRALPCKATCPTSLSLSRSQRRKIACGWTNQLSTWRFVRFTTSPSRVSPAGCRFNSVTQLLLDYFSVRRESIWFFFNMGKNGKDRSPADPTFQQVSLQFCSPCAYSNKIKIGVTLRDGFFFYRT